MPDLNSSNPFPPPAPALKRSAARVIRTWHMDSRRWDLYHPRSGDIVVATYPKCGTTWMQRIVSLLIFQSPEPRPISAMAPWIDARFLIPVKDDLARIEAQDHRRSLKSHLPLDALPFYDAVSYIHVARDGLDAFMSWHNHSLRYKGNELLDAAGMADSTIGRPYPRVAATPQEFFQDWMGVTGADRQSDVSAADFFDTEKSYWNARHEPNMLLVHYNNLSADLDGEMRRISNFLHIDVQEKIWPNLVNAAKFESMRRDGKALLPNIDRRFVGGHEGFINSGQNERWREALGSADIAHYRDRAARELEPELAHWLQTGSSA